MGGKSSKSKGSKKEKRGKKGKGKDAGKGKEPETDPAVGAGAAGDDDAPDIHPSWNDEILFSGDGKKKIGKDDFELLAVIGKGSFGKVRVFSAFSYF